MEKIELLERLKAELQPLEDKKELFETKALFHVQFVKYSVLVFLVCQILLYGRLTWWEFDWGFMEPVTYFSHVVETIIAGYIFYTLNKKEYENTTANQLLYNRRFKKLIRKNRFDMKYYQELKQRIEELKQTIELYKDH